VSSTLAAPHNGLESKATLKERSLYPWVFEASSMVRSTKRPTLPFTINAARNLTSVPFPKGACSQSIQSWRGDNPAGNSDRADI